MKEYIKWKNYTHLDNELKEELNLLTAEEIKESFYTDLNFGTGGIRGIMGVGINRMNIYTLRKAAYGYGKYLLKYYNNPQIAIAYDNRKDSKKFALNCAFVMGAMGIKSFIFKEITPTPVLSFTIRHLNLDGGIVITASHNPPIYNGFKVYDNDGSQLVENLALQVIEESKKVEDIFNIPIMDLNKLEEQNFIQFIGEEIYSEYLKRVKTLSINKDLNNQNFKVVFTPLHGTGGILGVRLLKELNYDTYPVKEQMEEDPNFKTVKSPNPEEKSAFELAIKKAKKVDADLCLATDPDADRIGLAFKSKNNEYCFLNGNQIGAIIIYYLVNHSKELNDYILLNTVVTSSLGAEIARTHNVEVRTTLIGYRYITEQIRLLNKSNKKLFFAYEESFGYLRGDFVRDKDSLQGVLLIAEITNYYKTKQMDLYDVLEEIHSKYGYYIEENLSYTYEGLIGKEKILKIMDYFRTAKLNKLDSYAIDFYEDYIEENNNYPKANLLKYYFDKYSWFALRPSGTEPKLKVYISIRSNSKDEGKTKLKKIKESLIKIINEVQ